MKAKMDNSNSRAGIIFFLVSFPIAMFFVGSVNFPRLSALSRNHKDTVAIVTKVTPNVHDRFQYEFLVDGKSYHGLSYISHRKFAIGTKVRIAYYPKNPEWSCELGSERTSGEDIENQRDAEAIFVIAMALMYSIGVTAAGLYYLKIWKAKRLQRLTRFKSLAEEPKE